MAAYPASLCPDRVRKVFEQRERSLCALNQRAGVGVGFRRFRQVPHTVGQEYSRLLVGKIPTGELAFNNRGKSRAR